MDKIFLWLLGLLFASSGRASGFSEDVEKVKYQYEVEKWLNNVDSDLSQFNSLAAHFTWWLSTYPDEKTASQASQLGKVRNMWKNKICESNIRQDWLTSEQTRKIYLLCRGPKFSDDLVVKYFELLGTLTQEYNSEICLVGSPGRGNNTANLPKAGDFLYGEPDLDTLMKRKDLAANELKWLWKNWHDSVGVRIKPLFRTLVEYQNDAARNNGYSDIGEIWRDELEIPNLEDFVLHLYNEIEPLYKLLHAVTRHKLYQKYGPGEINPRGPIPVHLLGNMWGQDWSPLIDLFAISATNINLNEQLRKKNMKVVDMVLESEDFYTSLTLPKMTNKFWRYSIFEEKANITLCHGTAANMYSKGDFRMLMCGNTTMYDFYVVHHEMGHIEYYVAYEEQPSIFQDGTNSAFHESVGDAIMHGVMTPQHLHRLRLITDEQLLDNTTELFLLFQQALSKIPEIPFSLIVDKYRWEIFRGRVSYDQWNSYYWALNGKFRGVIPPEERPNSFFDAGAKFHIPDNTPYIRYFLSSIIQMQVFTSLCELSLYGRTFDSDQRENYYLPLHRCDIYGSKNAGKRLWSMMQKGSSIHWTEALRIVSGTPQISVKPLLDYYKPIYEWLQTYVQSNNVYIGW